MTKLGLSLEGSIGDVCPGPSLLCDLGRIYSLPEPRFPYQDMGDDIQSI